MFRPFFCYLHTLDSHAAGKVAFFCYTKGDDSSEVTVDGTSDEAVHGE